MTSIPIWRVIDAKHLANEMPYKANICLGSFWPNSTSSYESHLIKTFKLCNPYNNYEPHISQICDLYINNILSKTNNQQFEYIARILSSNEETRAHLKPLDLLINRLAIKFRANNITDLFFRTSSRPPMRALEQLSGTQSAEKRIKYAATDLFIKQGNLKGKALLIDDIYNTGASMMVYAWALKNFAGIEEVFCINLAATRFNKGKDGHGFLKIDTSKLESCNGFGEVLIDSHKVWHSSSDCPNIKKPSNLYLEFYAKAAAKTCSSCILPETQRKWWKIW